MGKKFVLNADDFGMTKEQNRAVLEGYNNGFLTLNVSDEKRKKILSFGYVISIVFFVN